MNTVPLPVISKPMIEAIIAAACQYYSCTEDELKMKSQIEDIVYRRKICYFLIAENVIISKSRIAQRFGFTDPRWISRSIEEIEAQRDIFPQISRDIANILQLANKLAGDK